MTNEYTLALILDEIDDLKHANAGLLEEREFLKAENAYLTDHRDQLAEELRIAAAGWRACEEQLCILRAQLS